ncbi:hypothetical protein L596_004860 [Steinernema carpocapsae]|nr:hypothetical protein L596_004860 [Steinernema carpocapsae]
MRNWLITNDGTSLNGNEASDMNTDAVFQPKTMNSNSTNNVSAAVPNQTSPAQSTEVPRQTADVTEHETEAQAEVRPNWRKRLKEGGKKRILKIVNVTVSPTSDLYYVWEGVVTVGCLYNLIIMVLYVFDDFEKYEEKWVMGNYIFDFCFIADIVVRSRKTFLSEGSEVTDTFTLLKHYVGTVEFFLDVCSLLPFELITLVVNFRTSFFRFNRLLKSHTVFEFSERAQFRTNYPHGMRIFMLIITCYLLFHINACVYFSLSRFRNMNSSDRTEWIFTYSKNANPIFPTCRTLSPIEDDLSCNYPEEDDEIESRNESIPVLVDYWMGKFEIINCSNFIRQYSLSIYWSALTLTTCGQQPYPNAWEQNALEVVDTVIGLIVFAVIVGSVGNVVSTMNISRSKYQEMMDGLRFYMIYRNVHPKIQRRVVQCIEYDYHARVKKDEKDIFESLPPRLQGEMAVQLHMETLKRVDLLRELEAGLLYELVLRLQQQMLVPGDYLCRKGEPAKEMYINKQGLLQRENDNGVYTNIKEGVAIGELSILTIEKDGVLAKRRHTVRAVGYTEVYILRREDVSEVLQDYPIVRVESAFSRDQGFIFFFKIKMISFVFKYAIYENLSHLN